MIPIIALILLRGAIWFLRRKSPSDTSLVEEETPTPTDSGGATPAGWRTKLAPVREWWYGEWWDKHPNVKGVVIPTTISYFGILWMIHHLWPTWVWAKVWADMGNVLVFHALFIWMVFCIHANKVWMARTAKLLGALAWAGLLTTTLGWTPWVGEAYWIAKWANEVKVATEAQQEITVIAPVGSWSDRIPNTGMVVLPHGPILVQTDREMVKRDDITKKEEMTPPLLPAKWARFQSRIGKEVEVTVSR